MQLSDFNYDLPRELIAQEGLPKRDEARLMVLSENGQWQHQSIQNLPEILGPGDLLILNDTRVLPLKLIGKKETGGKVDCLLLPDPHPNGSIPIKIQEVQEALVRGSRIVPGTKITFRTQDSEIDKRVLLAEVIEKIEGARYKVKFNEPTLIEKLAEIPLPPYIKSRLTDPERYQTVYSEKAPSPLSMGSLAAPTAGLHFTPELMDQLRKRGIEFAFLTLHIGIGTFAPIRREKFQEWEMAPEYYKCSEETANKINKAIESKKRIFAVGTTSVRALETIFRDGKVQASAGWTKIFIVPGTLFKFPYAGLLTNFHLPQSTLILLVCALAGRENILNAYREAIEKKYRFYSFGDAMLILKERK